MLGGWAGWRWPPSIRGVWWSANQHLVDPRLEVGTVTQIVDFDAEAVSKRIEHLRCGVEADLLGFPRSVDRQIPAAHVVAGIVGDESCRQTSDKKRVGMC